MRTFTIKENDTAPELIAILKDINGPVNLATAISVILHMGPKRGPLKINSPVLVSNPSAGEVTYQWQTVDTNNPGIYHAEFEVHWNDGRIETFPSEGVLYIEVTEEIA